MATITLTLSDVEENISVKIVSTDPELPKRPMTDGDGRVYKEIKSSDPDLTPAQAMVFEMLELYISTNKIEEGSEADLDIGHKQCCPHTGKSYGQCEKPAEEQPKKKCCGKETCKKIKKEEDTCKRETDAN
jgi:hypothetical protein